MVSFGHALFTALWLLSCLLLAIASPTAAAQAVAAPRELVVIEGADLFGQDYETRKDLELEACKAACLADPRCRAFTYNTRARWCFLKSDYRDQRPFAGAVSGTIADAKSEADPAARRQAELGFLPKGYAEEARSLAARIAALPLSGKANPARLSADARAAAGSGQPQRAASLYQEALRRSPEDASLWLELATALLAVETADWQVGQRLRVDATAAAYNGHLRARTEAERARALSLLGRSLEERSAWRPAIRALRASLVLADNAAVRETYDRLLAEHGFRITGHRVDSDAANPRICLELSDALPRGRVDLADFVQTEGRKGLAVEMEPKQICVDGVAHGERYRIRVRAGLPSADGETLPKTADLDIYVRDRAPSVRFPGRAYVLPKGGVASLPLVSVNSRRVETRLYRVGDRALAGTQREGTLLKPLSGEEAQHIAEQVGTALWAGSIELDAPLNRELTTAVAVGELIRELAPGAYVMTARPSEAKEGDSATLATQWFVVSDLGLAAFSGSDGLHALVRSLTSAGPLPKVTLRLTARNDEVLGRAVTDASGYARFEPGLLRGSGGNVPALLVAEGAEGDYAFLDLSQSPFDLTDRGVDGRPAPKAIDAYLVTERGVYRPGETVHLTVLARDPGARALSGLPLTLILRRPDGVEHTRLPIPDQGLGGGHLVVALLTSAMHGTWRAAVYADPKEPALAERPFLVEDFEPERVAFDLAATAPAIDPRDPPAVTLDARFLFGAPAAALAVEGEVVLKPTDRLPAHRGFRFGLADEEAQPDSRPLEGARTDAAGKARLSLVLPESPALTRPLEASVQVRVLEGGGRPVERALSLPVISSEVRIGIRPLFEASVEEGGNAAFEIIAVAGDGTRVPEQGLTWTLSRVQTSFQWYQVDGRWDYEPVINRQRVAGGNLDLGSDGVGRVESGVEWGGYELKVTGRGGGPIPASLGFEAGWYRAPKAVDTPDLLKVSLDKPRYRIGETARAHIQPRYPGRALVLVVDDRLVSMTPVEIPAEGATVELPVTAEWGPGVYVAAVLFRPMDLGAKRMPARAIGLAWAGVDPGERRLELKLRGPEQTAPRAPLDIELGLANLSPGEEAYVSLAAVDVGILNLTRYATPAPDGWYFGQRRLGMEIRDLYGQLIDRMQGVPGVIRSGGDGGLLRFEGPPPTEALVAFHSGIVRVDADGRARVAFDLPDFNGTLRVMAMAWSAAGVGHAELEVLVRDPVVITASLPRFLAPGDRSRLLLDLAQVEGPAGEVTLAVEAQGAGIGLGQGSSPRTLGLAQGERARVEVPLEGFAVGNQGLAVRLTTSDGRVLSKQLKVAVRTNQPAVPRTSVSTLTPGAPGLALAPDLLADRVPGTGSVLVSAGGAGYLDVPGLLQALDRYPYGCAEQLTSRALPLLYLNPLALAAGLAAEPEAAPRVREAIADLLGKQSSSGGFGLWGVGEGDLWLDAYVTDFLTRAREQGYAVPDTAFNLALDNLRNRLAYAPDFPSGGEDLAYALYVLSRNARAVIGDLRYYAEAKLEAFATPLAKAQIGAALALYGDRPRADTAFRAAVAHLGRGEERRDAWRGDYGSALRDTAAVLALAVESRTQAVDVQALVARIEAAGGGGVTSTQENAWLLLAAQALMQGAGRPDLALDGAPLEGPFYRRFGAAELAGGVRVLSNRGPRPIDALVTVTGVPLSPPPAGGVGYRIERAYYDLEGRRVQPDRVAQGERLVVVISVHAEARRAARLILEDPLPAGFEIENPNLIRAGEVANIPWIGLVETAGHQEARADRFIAALERTAEDNAELQLAYRVRAVSPGRFTHPAASVEDMYRPHLRGWTGSGVVEVVAAQR